MSRDRRGVSLTELAMSGGIALVVLTLLWAILIQATRGSARVLERAGEVAGLLAVGAQLQSDLAAASRVESSDPSAIQLTNRGGAVIRYRFEPATGFLERDGRPLRAAPVAALTFDLLRDRGTAWLVVRLTARGATARPRTLRLAVSERPSAGFASLWNEVDPGPTPAAEEPRGTPVTVAALPAIAAACERRDVSRATARDQEAIRRRRADRQTGSW